MKIENKKLLIDNFINKQEDLTTILDREAYYFILTLLKRDYKSCEKTKNFYKNNKEVQNKKSLDRYHNVYKNDPIKMERKREYNRNYIKERYKKLKGN